VLQCIFNYLTDQLLIMLYLQNICESVHCFLSDPRESRMKGVEGAWVGFVWRSWT